MDEYISRQEVVKEIKSRIYAADDAWESGYNTAMAEIMEWIKHIPAADVQPVKHGRWERRMTKIYACSECTNEVTDRQRKNYSFCPYCGARMGGDSE